MCTSTRPTTSVFNSYKGFVGTSANGADKARFVRACFKALQIFSTGKTVLEPNWAPDQIPSYKEALSYITALNKIAFYKGNLKDIIRIWAEFLPGGIKFWVCLGDEENTLTLELAPNGAKFEWETGYDQSLASAMAGVLDLCDEWSQGEDEDE